MSRLSLFCIGATLVLLACGDDSSGGGASGSGGAGGATSSTSVTVGQGGAPAAGEPLPGWQRSFADTAVAFDCSSTLGELEQIGAPMINVGGGVIAVGYRQDGQNQNPVVMRIDGGFQQYCVEHEIGAPDGRAYGLSWDGGAEAYVVFTVDGGGSGLESGAAGGWLSSYGQGGGAKVSFVGRIDTQTGAMTAGSFVIAKTMDGKTNSHSPIDAAFPIVGGGVEFRGDSAFRPLNPDQSTMECGDYPFATKYVLSDDLTSLLCSSASNCIAASPCP